MMDMPTFLFFILLLAIIGGVAYAAFLFGRNYERELYSGPKYTRNPANQQLEPVFTPTPTPDPITPDIIHGSMEPKRKPLSRIIKNPSAEEVRKRHEQEELRKAEAELQTTKREGGTFVK